MTKIDGPATTTTAALKLLKVGEISGTFLVPAYQRGYRWEQDQVKRLLDDIWENRSGNYCLQPIVVKRLPDGKCELIDGQQRLTTLYLIYRYLKQAPIKDAAPRFSLEYKTRSHSAQFLASIDETKKDDNIDFSHMAGAYACIRQWFAPGGRLDPKRAAAFNQRLSELVFVIWYEVSDVDSVALFTRLNVGRIPLTNAELVKALLLQKGRDSSGAADQVHERRQIQIATQWDLIERELHDDAFWAFLTNRDAGDYPTRIELLFELLAGKPPPRESFHTFYYFKKQFDDKRSQEQIWEQILDHHALLKEWYENRDLYHKIGFLVASSGESGDELRKLIAAASGLTKHAFGEHLDDAIKLRLTCTRHDISDLAYDSKRDKCSHVLLLFNVETVRTLKDSLDRYPFHTHKKARWSLEHIHAQNADEYNKKEQWEAWLKAHCEYLPHLKLTEAAQRAEQAALIPEIETALKNLSKEIFDRLARRVTALFSDADASDDPHDIDNLALLSREVNSKLGKAAFAIKRQRILEMDRAGEYLPICTRRVFLKYYGAAGDDQAQFWSKRDRESYLEAMFGDPGGLLTPYLTPSAGGTP